MFDDDLEYHTDIFDDSSAARSLQYLNIPLDRAVMAEAFRHLREQPWRLRKRWHRQLEAVLHRYARRQQFRREPVRTGSCIQIWWMPHGCSPTGFPQTDIERLRDPELHEFAPFRALLREISEQEGLARVVVVSLLVRRDYQFGDFASIQRARAIYDEYRPESLRTAYRWLREAMRLRETSRKATSTLKDRKRREHEPIVEELRRLRAKKTPRRHWAKSALVALRERGKFDGKTDEAALRAIRRTMRAHFPANPSPDTE